MNEIHFERGDGWQALSGDRLRVEFRWQDDRWGHAVCVRGPTGWRPVLRSAELSVEPNDSPTLQRDGAIQTPALQQLHVDTIDRKTCAMGVGQAGAHHFATTFLLEPRPARLWVDVADRIREPQSDGGRVVSAYELADGAPADDVENASESEAIVMWHPRGAENLSLRLRASREPSLNATVAFERDEQSASRLTVRPGASAPTLATRRWVYCVELADE